MRKKFRIIADHKQTVPHGVIDSNQQCRPYGYEDDCDEETVKYVARILAKLHSLRTPVSNKGAQLWNEMWDSVLADPVISSKEHLKQLKTNEKYRDEYCKFKLKLLTLLILRILISRF